MSKPSLGYRIAAFATGIVILQLMNAANGNYTDFPETWFYYGGAEVLRGAAPYY